MPSPEPVFAHPVFLDGVRILLISSQPTSLEAAIQTAGATVHIMSSVDEVISTAQESGDADARFGAAVYDVAISMSDRSGDIAELRRNGFSGAVVAVLERWDDWVVNEWRQSGADELVRRCEAHKLLATAVASAIVNRTFPGRAE